MHISLVSYIVLVTRVKFNEKGGLMFDNTKGNIVPIKSDKVFHILLNKENIDFIVNKAKIKQKKNRPDCM